MSIPDKVISDRLAAQDRLILVLIAALVQPDRPHPLSIAGAIDGQADEAEKAGAQFEALVLRARAKSVRSMV